MTWKAARPRIQDLIRFWQAHLDLRDLYVELVFDDSDDKSESLNVYAAVDQENTHDFGCARLTIYPPTLDLSWADISSTIAHELIHVLLWPLAEAFDGMDEQLTKAQKQLINELSTRGDETTTCRLERIFTNHIKLPKALLTDLESDVTVNPKRKKRLRRRSIHKSEQRIGFHADTDD